MSDDLTAEIAAHALSAEMCAHLERLCIKCEEHWPCLVRRLADAGEAAAVMLTREVTRRVNVERLTPYVRHVGDCGAIDSDDPMDDRCTCGLRQTWRQDGC